MGPLHLLSTVKTRSWLSFSLFGLVYLNLGWLLQDQQASWRLWLLILLMTLGLAEALASPWSVIRNICTHWFNSSLRGFITAMIAAFVAVILLTEISVFSHIVLLLSAGLLYRLDATIMGLTDIQALFLILITALLGLGIGSLSYFIIHG
ncbi:MAG: hypothetical protein EA395_00225 [Phormidium sp. GEM2.Bin31]|nr:MAG: hypothetical protein EA395_00225 [Phormidium sp. GEM2.Bin31]